MRVLDSRLASVPTGRASSIWGHAHRHEMERGAVPMSEFLTGLECTECHARFPAEARSICEECFGPLHPTYDLEALRAKVSRQDVEDGPPSLWRYQALLPATRDPRVDLGDGFTPLRKAERLGAELGLPNLYVKDDTRNPTHSFKDRVVSVALTSRSTNGGRATRSRRMVSVAALLALSMIVNCTRYVPKVA